MVGSLFVLNLMSGHIVGWPFLFLPKPLGFTSFLQRGLWCSTINHHGQKISFESHSIISKLWAVCGLLNTKCTPKKLKGIFFFPQVVWKGADCTWTVCRSWSSAAVVCLASPHLQDWWYPGRQEGDGVRKGWGKWSEVLKLLAGLFTHPKRSLFSHLLNLLC